MADNDRAGDRDTEKCLIDTVLAARNSMICSCLWWETPQTGRIYGPDHGAETAREYGEAPHDRTKPHRGSVRRIGITVRSAYPSKSHPWLTRAIYRRAISIWPRKVNRKAELSPVYCNSSANPVDYQRSGSIATSRVPLRKWPLARRHRRRPTPPRQQTGGCQNPLGEPRRVEAPAIDIQSRQELQGS